MEFKTINNNTIALKKCIKHWEEIIAYFKECKANGLSVADLDENDEVPEDIIWDTANCALCMLYVRRECEGCPMESCTTGSKYAEFSDDLTEDNAEAVLYQLEMLLIAEENK